MAMVVQHNLCLLYTSRLWEWKVFLGNLKKWFCAFIYIAFFVTVMKKEAEFEKIFNGNEIVLNVYTICLLYTSRCV